MPELNPQIVMCTSEGRYSPGFGALPTPAGEGTSRDGILSEHLANEALADGLVSDQYFRPPLEYYGQLSQILFQLQSCGVDAAADSNIMSDTEAEQQEDLQETFRIVNTFCDLVEPLLRDMHSIAEEAASSCLLLAISVANAVADVYQSMMDREKTAWLAFDGSGPFEPRRTKLGTKPLLVMVLNARTMDFHLQQLQKLSSPGIAGAEISQNQQKLAATRQELQKWSEELQATP